NQTTQHSASICPAIDSPQINQRHCVEGKRAVRRMGMTTARPSSHMPASLTSKNRLEAKGFRVPFRPLAGDRKCRMKAPERTRSRARCGRRGQPHFVLPPNVYVGPPVGGTFWFQIFIQAPSLEIWRKTISGAEGGSGEEVGWPVLCYPFGGKHGSP